MTSQGDAGRRRGVGEEKCLLWVEFRVLKAFFHYQEFTGPFCFFLLQAEEADFANAILLFSSWR